MPSDATVLDHGKVRPGFSNEVDATDTERETGDDVHEMVLVGKKS